MFKVIIDTREKIPWSFNSAQVIDTEVRKLDTGDYTVEGLEKILCIERKRNLGEFAANMIDPRFTRELERMSEFEMKYLIIEASYQDVKTFPVGSNIPQSRWDKVRVKSFFMLKYISQVQTIYGVHVILAGDTEMSKHVATNIMKRAVELHGEDN